ncbi:MAG: GntR family transcriptional regulator [Caldilineales bacterium]|nr:GntR family transcriptional regulator [Caldilineales bacterium]
MALENTISDHVTHSALLSVDPEAVINKDSPVPLHHQLELFLRHGIESGLFPPHSTLPTEHELQDYFQLSRTPIRQALATLSAEGLVDRRRSQGTVVLPTLFEESLNSLTTFTQEVTRKGLTPGCKMLIFERIPASAEDIRLMKLKEDAEVFHIRRLRTIDDEPMGILTAHIPVSIAPTMTASDFREEGLQQSIYYVLEHIHNIKLVRASDTFRAVSLDKEDADLLKVPPQTAVLMRSRVASDTQGTLISVEKGLYRGIYRIEWNGQEVSSIDTSALPEETQG